ncbi:hypothetical protein KPH14_006884 [Odynerus spinipes]|uniref:Odorant receptor n=1 Tax=Odynerus spinipes TaxID=1348599 RepID=A0AAD9RSF3_9HYME|nr:hypothetical protein KPH14_006884 [Odynerus spinipes]
MSVSKDDYYSINKVVLSLVGQWPYQAPWQKFILSVNVILGISSQMYLQTRALIAAWTNWDLVIELLSAILIQSLCLLKFLNCLFNARKMKILLVQMQDAWKLKLTDKEREILHIYALEGNKFSWVYVVTMYVVTFLYATLPHIPTLVAFVSNKNETIQGALLFDVEQVVDREKYYYVILIHSFYTTFLLITLPASADSMFLVFVQYACAKFSLIGQQLETIQDDNIDVNIHVPRSEDKVYKKIINSIIDHKNALKFAELLASTYSSSFLFQTGLNVAVITFNGVQAVICLDGRKEEALRFCITALTVSFHFLFLSLPCQKLLDHSLQINDSIYCSNWYATSIKSRRLLELMLMRSRIPSQITAGKIYMMSLENFGSAMQASMSYFTVLTSIR